MTTESNYGEATDAIGEQLKAYFLAQSINVRVEVEQDPVFGLPDDGGRACVVEAMRRTPSVGQSMAAGRRLRSRFTAIVTAIGFDMESYQKAARKRDDVIEKIELGIMSDRSIGGRVVNLEIQGGEFYRASAPGNTGPFCSMGETLLEMDISAIS